MTIKEKKINILCSADDRASLNIKKKMLLNTTWERIDITPGDWEELISVHENRTHRIIEIKGHHIYEDGIDRKMISSGYDTDLIIVASKHKSNDGRSVLTAHYTGNTNAADLGGRPRELSFPAPGIMCSILKNMQYMAKETHYTVNMESTHHGPTDLSIPMVYAEIGSSEEQWNDPIAGNIVSRAILEATPEDLPVGIGFGGGHYAARQTELILQASVTFGHNFPDHQLKYVDRDMIIQAYEKSGADFVYFDRKSMSSKERKRLSSIIDELGYISLRESEIKEIKGIPWKLFIKIKRICDDLCPDGKMKVTELFRSSFKNEMEKIQNEDFPAIDTGSINEELLHEAIKTDKRETTEALEKYAPIYIEKKNGTMSNYIVGIGECVKTAMQNVTNECIKILKEHYEIKYIPDENILYIISKRFDPESAKELGIPPGPKLGELAKGNSVVVGDRTIEPDMVHKRVTKKILLTN